MLDTLIEWVNINTYSTNLEGLKEMRALLKRDFSKIGDLIEVSTPPYLSINEKGQIEKKEAGACLKLTKRETALTQILLCGHMDTVFPTSSPFQKAHLKDQNTLIGPGVADMKGGLFVMLQALLKFEEHPLSKNIGYEVFINSDEEIGSPSSKSYFEMNAKRFHCALLFEPAFSDGAIAGRRKGSLNLFALSKGKSAHAGRDFDKGINAITPLCRFCTGVEMLTDLKKGLHINVGKIRGGNALNVVPDFAFAGINCRMESGLDDLKETLKRLADKEGITLFESSSRPPKPLNPLYTDLEPVEIRDTGGACDGNLLASYGLDNIDALGPVGGNLHTEEEFLLVDSIPKRIDRALALLIKIAKRFS